MIQNTLVALQKLKHTILALYIIYQMCNTTGTTKIVNNRMWLHLLNHLGE